MPRPRFAPGSVAAFAIKARPGPPRDAAAYVATRLGVPAGWLEGFAEAGRIMVDGRALAAGEPISLAQDAALTIHLPDPWPPHLPAHPLPLRVLDEDEHLLVLDKPAGMLVHPARGHMREPTLLGGVRHRYRADLGRPGATVGAAHRLDVGTSGVIVFARDTATYRALAEQFAAGAPHKEYLALVDGAPPDDHAEVRAPLGRDPERPTRCAVVAEHFGGRPAVTEFHVLERGDGWARVRAVPRTGRLHQIRVHLAHWGAPILGDLDYNRRPPRVALDRPALHAAALKLTHPADSRPRRWVAPWPDDLEAARLRLGGAARGSSP